MQQTTTTTTLLTSFAAMYTHFASGSIENKRNIANSAHTVLPEPVGEQINTLSLHSYNAENVRAWIGLNWIEMRERFGVKSLVQRISKCRHWQGLQVQQFCGRGILLR